MAADLSAELGLPVVELPDFIRNKEKQLGLINKRLSEKKAKLNHILKEFNSIGYKSSKDVCRQLRKPNG